MVRLGIGAYIGIGELANWLTTPGASDMELFLKATSGFDGMNYEHDHLDAEDLQYYDAHKDTVDDGMERVTGSLMVRPTYESLQNLLRWITGHNVSPTGSGPYTYAFVPIDPANASFYPRGKSLGVEIYRGGSDANSLFYGPLTFNEVTFNFEQNGFMTIDLGILGKSFVEATKSAAPSFGSTLIKLPTGQADASGASEYFLQINGSQYICRSASLKMTHGLVERTDITNLSTLEPYPDSRREVTLECEVEVDDDTLIGNLKSGTEMTGTNWLQVYLSATYSIKFEFDCLKLNSPAEPRVNGPGVVTASLSLRALRDDSNPAYKVTLINDDSGYAS